MRIEAHNGLAQVLKADVTRVVVYDDYDNPISVAFKYAQGVCYTGHIDDEGFNQVLKLLGVDKVTVLTTLNPDEMKAHNPSAIRL